MSKITLTRRYEILYDKNLYALLRDIQYAVYRIKNKATSLAWNWQQFSFSYHENHDDYPQGKETLGKSLTADIYRKISGDYEDVGSKIIGDSIRESVKKFQHDMPDIVRGRVSVPSYRRTGAFPLRAKTINRLVRADPVTYLVKLSLLSRKGAKKHKCSTQLDVTLRTGGKSAEILDRIIDGTYKMTDSRITYGEKKRKFYLLLAYQFEIKPVAGLDRKRVMGVDLGIVKVATMAFNFDEFRRQVIDGGEITAYMDRVNGRRRSMQHQGKYCGSRAGHGRKSRLRPTTKLRGKIRNFRNMTNHRYAKYIVKQAVKNGCGTIQMEKLDGIAEGSTFLVRWPYSDLQRDIKYKAKMAGIKVVMVDPKYTSQRCSHCGHIEKHNRDSQAVFECLRCGYKVNADFNAARNIAVPGIDKIIEEAMPKKPKKKAKKSHVADPVKI